MVIYLKKITIRVDTKTKKKVVRKARKLGTSESEVGRRALKKYLK